MKRMIPFVLTAILAAFIAAPLSAKEFLAVSNLIGQAVSVTTAKYPDADDVTMDDVMEVVYQPDGTSETWGDTAIKILTEKGKRDHNSLSLSFNVSYGSNTFTRVQVIKPDGTANEVDIQSHSKVMVDPGQMSANIFNPNSKVLKLSVPGLEVGDILRFVAHETRYKTVVPGMWSDYQVFEDTSPIMHATYRIVAPSGLPLKKTTLKAEVKGTVTHTRTDNAKDGTTTYVWEVRDVPRFFPEPNMPTPYTVVQRLLVSTMEKWEDLSKWYWKLCLPRLEATTPEMEAKARELVAGATNTMGKIEAIFNFVSQDIRYMGITTEDEAPGYEPHDVDITFNNRYGVCRDKTALLAAMLRIVDIEAFPVIIMVGPKKDGEVPQPLFNHAVTAALDDNGEYVLMDSTDENTKDIFPAYLQNMSYLVARPDGDTLRTTPIIPAGENLLRIASDGTLDDEGNLRAHSTLRFEGINDTAYRGYFSKIKPEERKRFFEGAIKKSMPTAELQSLQILPAELRDTSQPLVIKMDYTADNLMIEGAGNSMLNFPRIGSSLGYANFLIGQTGLEKRKYPLFNRMTAGIRETFDLTLPSTAGTPNIPRYLAIDTPQLTWNIDVSQHGGRLASTNNFLLNTVEFSPEEYLVLKENLKDIEYNLRKNLVFDVPENGDANPDVRIIEQSRDFVLGNETRWRETTRTKMEILTYAGTKQYSEIKVPYNPAWQTIELKKAVVKLPDGTVKNIRAEEINTMDASWVATAPRYPAEKILVANLPGVEVGSIVDYEIVSTVDGKPFFSAEFEFNGHEPIERRTVTLTSPSSMDVSIRNTGIAETKTASKDSVTYVWSASNQSAVKKEEDLPAWWIFNPSVFISTSDWKSYGRNVRDHLLAATENQDATAALAKRLVDGLREDADKVVALRDWVALNIREAGPGLTSLPLSSITPSDQTLGDRYGNNTDRMVLLYTMLKTARFNPEFVLSGGISLIPEVAEPLVAVPSRSAFDTVLIKVDVGRDTVYLNGSSQYAQLGTSVYNQRAMLDLDNGRVGQVEVAPGKNDRNHEIVEINISANGQAGLSQSTIVQGTAFEVFHKTYAEITPENLRRHYLEMVSAVSQSAKAVSKLVTDYASYPGKREFSVVADRYAVRDKEYLYFTIPAGINGLLQYRSNQRDNPLAWDKRIDTMVEYNITLPEGFEPAILPPSFSWQAPEGAGLIDVAVNYSKRAHAVRIVQLADLRPALIPAGKFPEIIEAGRQLAHPAMRTILLKKKPQAAKPTR